MRETLTSGSTRGEEVGLWPRFPSYSTGVCHVCVPLIAYVADSTMYAPPPTLHKPDANPLQSQVQSLTKNG